MIDKSINRRNFVSTLLQGCVFFSVVPALGNTLEITGHSGKNNFGIPFSEKDENSLIDMALNFTQTYKKYADNLALREVECLRIQYPFVLGDFHAYDYFAGRRNLPLLLFSPQVDGGFGYFYNFDLSKNLAKSNQLSEKNKTALLELEKFWEKENSNQKCINHYPKEMSEMIPERSYGKDSGISFFLYRMSGSQLNHDKLVKLGIPGLKKEIEQYGEKNSSAKNLYSAMQNALDLLSEICVFYANLVQKVKETITNNSHKNRLQKTETALRNIAVAKPQNLREAIQLSYLYTLFSGSLNYGRMDEYLGDFLENELQNKTLTEEEAIDLVAGFWRIIDTHKKMYDSRLILGGKGRRNEANADKFALVAMDATRRNHLPIPQVSLRFYKEQNPDLWKKALETIGEGCTFPMLYNDDVNINAVQKALNVPIEDAVNYVSYGCGEYIIHHKSVATPSGLINLLQALIVTLHNGFDPKTGQRMGLATGEISSFTTFEKLYDAYKKQVEHHVELLAQQEALEYKIAGETAPFLFLSMLYDNCIERGKGIFDGGVSYLGGILESYGNTNTADSFVAINELVYNKKLFTLEQLVKMLDANFVGFEKEQKLMVKCPKYGNDNELADKMKVEIDQHICTVTKEQAAKVGLHSYLVVIINNDAGTLMGMNTAASPDGRKAWTFMANGNMPYNGLDQSGVTAMLNSLVKSDITIHAGAVQNMKFSKEMFTTYRDKVDILLKTYFQKGGAQAMISVVGKDDLLNALKEPQKYTNLIVRVGGFSARFIDLYPEQQQEIINRTLN